MAKKKGGNGKIDLADPPDVEYPADEAKEQKALVAKHGAQAPIRSTSAIKVRDLTPSERAMLLEVEQLKLARQILAGLFLLTVVLVVAHVWKNDKDVLEVLKYLAPLATLVIGFYFAKGSRSR